MIPGTISTSVLQQQLVAVDHHIERLSHLRGQLIELLAVMCRTGSAASEDLLALMKEMKDVEKYYTSEQLDALAQRREVLGDEGMRQVEAQWANLIDRVCNARNAGLVPASLEVRELAAEWQLLVDAFTGGDPGISQSLNRVWQEEDQVAGFDAAEMRGLMTYIGQAAD